MEDKNMRSRTLLLAASLLGLSGFVTAANAVTETGTFTITVWHTTAAGGLITSPDNQATNANPLTGTTALATFTYTGNLNFNEGSGGTNTIAAFIASGGGAVSNCVGGGCTNSTTLSSATDLSLAGFNDTSLFRITGSNGTASNGTITHDDGAGLYDSANALKTPSADTAPSNQKDSAYSNLSAGAFSLFYVEANGLPAVLDFEETPIIISVPEPTSLALFGAGLFGLGLLRRRRRKTVA
jgi:hypothetical protein